MNDSNANPGRKRLPVGFRIGVTLIGAFILLNLSLLAFANDAIKRGEYIFRVSGGCSCHTDPGTEEDQLAGGRAFKTPFGTIFSTNITPDPQTGIGKWTEQDFLRAMQEGVRADGAHLFPLFPYTSFAQIKKQDLTDLKAFLDTFPAISKTNKPVDMWPPFSWRFGLFFWKLMNFSPGGFEANRNKTVFWNRGAYLVKALSHCHECHTPRDIGGAIKEKYLFAGSHDGPEGQFAPNITADMKTGIGKWTKDEVIWFLQSGQKPDGDYSEGVMAEVIQQGYQYIKPEDLAAMADFIKDLAPIQNK